MSKYFARKQGYTTILCSCGFFVWFEKGFTKKTDMNTVSVSEDEYIISLH